MTSKNRNIESFLVMYAASSRKDKNNRIIVIHGYEHWIRQSLYS